MRVGFVLYRALVVIWITISGHFFPRYDPLVANLLNQRYGNYAKSRPVRYNYDSLKSRPLHAGDRPFLALVYSVLPYLQLNFSSLHAKRKILTKISQITAMSTISVVVPWYRSAEEVDHAS